MINQLTDKEQEIIAEAVVADVLNKKIVIVCSDNDVKQRLLKLTQMYGVESVIEIQVPPRDIGKRAEAVIIDEINV